MQVTWILLVSTYFIYNEVCGTLSDSKRACAEISTKRTLLEPYMSKYNDMFKGIQYKCCRNKSRDVLSAVVVETLRAPFSPENWEKILEKTSSFPITSENWDMSDDFKEPSYYSDTDEYKESIYHRILDDLISIILVEIDDWLKTKQEGKIENFSIFESHMVDFINISMTELMTQQRKGIMNVQDYLTVFYVLLDIENVFVEDSEREKKIIELLSAVDKWFCKLPNFKRQLRCEKSKYKSNLIDNLNMIDKKTNSSFGFSISSMKMKLLINPTKNEALKQIQNLKPFPFDQRTISEYVNSYAQEVDAYRVNEYHVSILSVLITHLFGYVHNHFKLLLKLQKHQINDADKNTIQGFSKFMNGYMSIFVDRYFEFKGEISQEIVDAMFPIMYFLNPSDPLFVDGNDLTKEEKGILNVPEKTTMTIMNYYDKSENQCSLEIEINNLVNKAVNVLIESFIGTVTDDTLAKWNKELEINFKEEFPNKQLLIEEMKKNNNNALSILTEFSCEFTVYGLN